MLYLIYIAILYLAITSIIFWKNRRDFRPLHEPSKVPLGNSAPLVSICIPARNEAGCIEKCVRSAVQQRYISSEVIVLDDGSTDATPAVLKKLSAEYPEGLTVIKGAPKPSGWLGKPWACHQLSRLAQGEILLFVDADTALEKHAVARLIRTMGRGALHFVTVWPMQRLPTFWEKTVVPLVYFSLLTLLPVRYVSQKPLLMPAFLYRRLAPYFAAACGQFMAFRKKSYEQIGGHESVKDKIVEDVALARKIRRAGLPMGMFHGRHTVSCRMYTGREEIWNGFRKNFLAGFGYNIPVFTIMGLLHLVVFIFPWITLAVGILSNHFSLIILSATVLLPTMIQRWTLNRWFDWNPLYAILHPVGVLWFQALGIRTLADYYRKVKVEWKDRPV